MSKAMTAASKEQLVELMQYLSQNISVPTIGIGGGFAPIGTIISYMGTTAPQDYLICDGTTYNIADYKQLSDFFAAQFGSANFFGGDGVTTFKVPDLRGEFLRGTGTNSHENQGSGANVGVHQDGTQHLKLVSDGSNKYIQVSSIDGYTTHNGSDYQIKSTPNNGYINTGILTNYTDADAVTKFTSKPTNTSVLYCIKAVAAGDVYSTTERVVGTWIDGKPLYQKTINCGALPNAGELLVDINVNNIEKVVDFNAICIDTNGQSIPIPNAICTNGEDIIYQINIFFNSSHKIRIVTGSNRTAYTGYVTIRYTKTTD